MSSIYNLSSDNLTSIGSPTLHTGTAAAGYPLTKAYDVRPDWPFKITTVGPLRITWDWGSARTLGLIALFNVLIDAGSAVVFQMHSSPITSSTSDITVPLVIPAILEDGRRPNPWVDLSVQVAKRYASLFVPANASATISIGEIWIGGAKRTFDLDMRPGVIDPEQRDVIEHGTEDGVSRVYDRGVTLRRFSGEMNLHLADDALFNTWWRSARGRVNPVLFILDAAVNDAMLVRLSTVKSHTRPYPALSVTTVDGTELSPGVPV